MDTERIIEGIHMDGYNEGVDDGYEKAWDDVADILDQAVEDYWSALDILDALYANTRKYADRKRPFYP